MTTQISYVAVLFLYFRLVVSSRALHFLASRVERVFRVMAPVHDPGSLKRIRLRLYSSRLDVLELFRAPDLSEKGLSQQARTHLPGFLPLVPHVCERSFPIVSIPD